MSALAAMLGECPHAVKLHFSVRNSTNMDQMHPVDCAFGFIYLAAMPFAAGLRVVCVCGCVYARG